MADTGAPSTVASLEKRHDGISPISFRENLGSCLGCRRYPLANKSTALSEIAKLLTAPPAEIAVIGDGGNDVAMFARCGLSIAMSNADSEVWRAADFVTDSNCDDGVANAVEQFILGGDRSIVQIAAAQAAGRAW